MQILIFGLPPLIITKIFQTQFYAKFNSRVPLIISSTSLLLHTSLSFLLTRKFNYLGVAVSTVITGWTNIIILIICSYKILNFQIQISMLTELIKYIISSILMIINMYIIENILVIYITKQLLLGFEILFGVISYFYICYLLKVKTFKRIITI